MDNDFDLSWTNQLGTPAIATLPSRRYCILEDTYRGNTFKYVIFIAAKADRCHRQRVALLETVDGSDAYWYEMERNSEAIRKKPGFWILSGVEPKNDYSIKGHNAQLSYQSLTASQLMKLNKGLSINHVYT